MTQLPLILAVDDDEHIRRMLTLILSTQGYQMNTASTGAEGIAMAASLHPALVILDMALPDMDGLEVCKTLRAWMTAPILFLSANERDTAKIAALDLGADDYLTKPFSTGELLARLRALLRRTTGGAGPEECITSGELVVDLASRQVLRAGVLLALTAKEFEILALLARHADCVFTPRMILEKVWGDEYAEDIPTLRVHIANLRKKIEPIPESPRYLFTERGNGYRFASR